MPLDNLKEDTGMTVWHSLPCVDLSNCRKVRLNGRINLV